jgi:hypothetical protein
VEPALNVAQFDQYIAFAQLLLGRLEREQRERLEQLSAGRKEHRQLIDL